MTKQASSLLLSRRAVVLMNIESTYGVNPTLSPTTDALLVSAPDYKVNSTVLNRNFVRESLSPLGHVIGRQLASMDFSVEFRSNGSTNSGNLSNECMLGRLLRACGYTANSLLGGLAVGSIKVASGDTSPAITWVNAGTSTLTNKSAYTATVVKGGTSTTAKIRFTGGVFQPTGETAYLPSEGVSASVTGNSNTVTLAVVQTDPLAPTVTVGGTFHVGDVCTVVVCGVTFTHTVVSGDTNLAGIATALATLIDADSRIAASPSTDVISITYTAGGAGIAVTSGSTALNIGSTGLTTTPTFSGSLVLGDSYSFEVYPQGIQYLPISTGFQSASLYMYFDGTRHELNGAYGTFSVDAMAGSYGTAKFTFTGFYVPLVDASIPNCTYETPLPAIVESAQLILGNNSFQPTVEKFTFDQANTITPRPDVNSSEGYNGVRITDRKPKGGIDPEATLVADYDWWGTLAASTQTALTIKIGATAGNIILMNAPAVQYTGLTYADRAGIKTYNAGLDFTSINGDDEMEFVFA
jgi:hypothetical protein